LRDKSPARIAMQSVAGGSPRHKNTNKIWYDRHMRKLFLIPALLVLFALPILSTQRVVASSSQAYQDYLSQFDQYRQSYSDFQVAKNEYAKFKSLSAQTDALTKTKLMLTKRNALLLSYLSLLNEKLNEDQGLSVSDKQSYQTLIKNEETFLETQSATVPSAQSLDDVTHISQALESHYIVLQTSIRQILLGLSLGQLSILAAQYDKTLLGAQAIITSYGNTFTPSKLETINQWMRQIKDKRTNFQQKYDSASEGNAQLKAVDVQELDQKYTDLTKNMTDARQYLQEGASFFIELTNALKYSD
jgi:hypothetical protein